MSQAAFLALLALLALPGQAPDEWPGILGASGDLGSSRPVNITLSAKWPETLWTKPVGAGYSGPVVRNGRAILHHRNDNREVVEAFSLDKGERNWIASWESRYSDSYGKGDGPRATPLIVGDLIVTHSPDGIIRALDFGTGKEEWKCDLAGAVGAKSPFFGFGASPAMVDGVIVLNAGGEGAGIVGIHPGNGAILWRKTSHPAGYATAIGIEGGLAAVFTRTGIVILRAKTGEVVFEKRWRSRMDASVNAASPVRWDQGLLFTSSYGTGCIGLKRDGGQWREAWSGDKSLSCHFATPVHVGGLVVGFHGRQEEGTELRCIEPGTGIVKWKKEGMGAGWLGVAGDKVVMVREDGLLTVFKPSGEGMNEIGSARILKGPCWSPCAISSGIMLARDGKELKAVRLGTTTPTR